jgi:hypothetical protein
MPPPPIVVLTRARGDRGWQLTVSEPGATSLDALPVNARVSWSAESGLQVHLGRAPSSIAVVSGGVLELELSGGAVSMVVFRATDQVSRPLGRVLLAQVEQVRAKDTVQTRQVLADALEETGALAEAEYVRRELALQKVDAPGSAAFADELQRFEALASTVGTTFRYLVGREVDGCAGLRWTFRCPRSWHELTPTAEPSLRFCSTCHRGVVEAASEAQAEALAAAGTCVALRAQPDVPMWVGSVAMPQPRPRPIERVTTNLAPRQVSLIERLTSWWKR